MFPESNIALGCPYCNEPIFEALSWFKQTRSACPNCERELSAAHFARTVADLEEAMEESVEEMLSGKSQGGGCCGSESSCGCG